MKTMHAREIKKPDVIVDIFTFIVDILKLIEKYDLYGDLRWTLNLKFYVECNDFFSYGTAETVDVTQDNLPGLVEALKLVEDDGLLLFCAQQRKMRPVKAAYEYIDEANWPIFDGCGPERK